MKVFECKLKSVTPLSMSKHHETPHLDKENPKDYENRTWRERLHSDQEGYVFIPPMCFKNCVAEAAKFLSLQVPGKGKTTYTKHFESGIIVSEGLRLPIKKEDVKGEWVFVPSDGKRGGGKRVMKCFPLIPEWKGRISFYVLDDTITKEVFEKVLREAGNLIGIMRFRPRNNGLYGRFEVSEVLVR